MLALASSGYLVGQSFNLAYGRLHFLHRGTVGAVDTQLGRAVALGDDGLFDPEEDLVSIARLISEVMVKRDDLDVFWVGFEEVDNVLGPTAECPAVRGGTFIIKEDSDLGH